MTAALQRDFDLAAAKSILADEVAEIPTLEAVITGGAR